MDPRTSHFWSAVDDMLSANLLFLNSRVNFNDPFDSRPVIKNDLSSSQIRNYFSETIQNPYSPNRSLKNILRISELKATGRTHLNKKGIETIKAGLQKIANELLDSAGLLSFSLAAENPLLWAHYAASYTGVCAIFKRSTSPSSFLSLCAQVSYVDERPCLPLSLLQELGRRRIKNEPSDDIATEIFYLSFLHKSSHWAYEQEARIFHTQHAFKKAPFDPSELIGFILGPNFRPEFEAKMRDAIRNGRPSVSLHRSTLSPLDFRIIIPHKFARKHRPDSPCRSAAAETPIE